MTAAAVDQRLVKAQSTPVAFVGIMARIEGVESFCSDVLAAAIASRIEHHLIETEQVAGCREETGMASNAAHCRRIGVVDIAAQLLLAE